MPTIAERSLRVALSGHVHADDPTIIADMMAIIEARRNVRPGCDEIALDAARTIEAIFAADHKGGDVRSRIQSAILDAIEAANDKLNPPAEK